ncbi:N-terminal binuclear Zn cluster-containing/DNA binding domain-containing protein [Trichoderma novae-zelandiae]
MNLQRQQHPDPSPRQAEIDRVLRLRRLSQARSCYPCRQRKVKCDHEHPCQTCQKRGHPEICSYDVGVSPEKRRGRRAGGAAAAAGAAVPPRAGRGRESSGVDSEEEPRFGPSRRRRQRQIRGAGADANGSESESSATHTHNTADSPSSLVTPQASHSTLFRRQDTAPADWHPAQKELYQGGSSVLTMLHGSADAPAVEMRRKAGPVLGLHNTLEFYPFMKLKTLQERWAALLKLIPQRQEVLRYFPSHGASIYPLNPVLLDHDDLESAFCDYLSALDAGELRNPDVPSPKWVCKGWISRIALLLASLATSAHYSVMQSPRKRSEHSLDFLQRAFDALCLANYVLHPSLDALQTLLIIVTVLQDVGQSDGAWVLMGTTARVAQALGLHLQSVSEQSGDGATRKRALWDAVCRQDCLLSLCHGRPHIASRQSLTTRKILSNPNRPLNFAETLYGMVSVCTGILELEQPSCESSMKLLAELEGYKSRSLPHMQGRAKCANIQQRYEALTVQVQLSWAASLLCRPALTTSAVMSGDQADAVQFLKSRAKEGLMNTTKAFIEFQALSNIPIRTWSMIHAVLSATILLCLWEETRCDQESRDVLQRVIEIFSRAAQADDETGMMVDASGTNHWLSMNHTRALVALQTALQKAPALNTSAPSSPQRQQAEIFVPQSEALPRIQDAASIDPMMEGAMGYDFTALLGEGLPMDGSMYPWDMSGLSPLMYLDSIMKAPYEALGEF